MDNFDLDNLTQQYLRDLINGMDAAMFTGDAFIEEPNRRVLSAYMARWAERIKFWEEVEKEDDDGTED